MNDSGSTCRSYRPPWGPSRGRHSAGGPWSCSRRPPCIRRRPRHRWLSAQATSCRRPDLCGRNGHGPLLGLPLDALRANSQCAFRRWSQGRNRVASAGDRRRVLAGDRNDLFAHGLGLRPLDRHFHPDRSIGAAFRSPVQRPPRRTTANLGLLVEAPVAVSGSGPAGG